MDNNGLCIDEKEFMSLPSKRQMCVLFQNQVKTMELIKGYKTWQKIAAIIGSVLTMGVAYLFKLHIS